MRVERTITVKASAERVWEVLTDVERWPEWTESMASVEFVAGTELTPGAQLRIRQPSLPVTVWTVTEHAPADHFTWAAASPIVTSVADHRITPNDDGTVTVTLTFEQWGLLSPLVSLFTRNLVRRYVDMEAEGLKTRAESP